MKAIVVYESHWGNTAAIARAIAEGIGPGARALTTTAAKGDAIAGADLIVAGSPLLGFSLPTEDMLRSIASPQPGAPGPADTSHPSMRSWLEKLTPGAGKYAAFETRAWITLGDAVTAIGKLLAAKGYTQAAPPEKFKIKGKYGPLKDGELERARAWGAELAKTLG